MTQSNYATKSVVSPTVDLTVNKSRVKRYNKHTHKSIYYLPNGQEFQLEIFNPEKYTVKAAISMNGNSLGSGLVLKPGERVFLDRHLDSPKKFIFETYEVGTSKEIENAIVENGLIEVKFYAEYIYQPDVNYIPTVWNNPYPWGLARPIYYTGTPNDFLRASTADNTTIIGSTNRVFTTNTVTMDWMETPEVSPNSNKKQETGMIGKGSKSNQEFQTVDIQFNSFEFKTIMFQILPLSKKQTTSEDLKVARYCSECGKKIKKTDKFCSTCGNKL